MRSTWLVLCIALGSSALAQRSSTAEQLTLHIEGLTSATRDALVKETTLGNELRIVFACVPAGIIVLESPSGLRKAQIEQRSHTLLNARSATLRTHILEHSLAQAEAACEQARTR